MTVLELKPHHERIAQIYEELKKATPEGQRIHWQTAWAEHPEWAEQLGLLGDSDGVRKLRCYVSDYIIRYQPKNKTESKTPFSLGYLSRLREHHDLLTRIYRENKQGHSRFQWNAVFREHPEYLEQLGLPPLDKYYDGSHTFAAKACSVYVGQYIEPKPSVLKKRKMKKNHVPPSRTLEATRAYYEKYRAKKKALKELAAQTQQAIKEIPTATAIPQASVNYCPNCGCELRQFRK